MRIDTWMDPNSRGARGSFWLAETNVDGRHFTARSQHGAPNELARLLASSGIPDQPVSVFNRDFGRVTLRYPSLHDMAKWTYEESASRPLQRVRWKPHPDNFDAVGGGNAENRGGSLQDDVQ